MDAPRLICPRLTWLTQSGGVWLPPSSGVREPRIPWCCTLGSEKRFPLRRDAPTSVLRLNTSNYAQGRTPRTDGTENPWRGNVEYLPLHPPLHTPSLIRISTAYSASCVRVIMIMRKNYFGWAGNVSSFPRNQGDRARPRHLCLRRWRALDVARKMARPSRTLA